MVTWSTAAAARAPEVRRPSTVVAWSIAALFAVAPAAQNPSGLPAPSGGTQQPATPAPANAVTPPAAAEAPKAPTHAPAPATTTYAKVVVDKAPLRCWPGAVASPPVFEESLVKDQVVVIGRLENGFRAIAVPVGPVGYVSKKFTETAADGVVKTKGSKVSFRYRPRSSEPPVSQLVEGTVLHVVGDQDDWFRVRVAGVDAWVAEAEVQIGDQGDASLATAYAAWQQKNEAEVKARLEALAAKAAREAQDQVDLAAVQVVQEAYAAELKKPVADQNYAPLYETLDKLVPTFAADSAGRAAVDELKKRMDTQRWIAEATSVRDSKPPVSENVPATKSDPLEAFQASGWLRYESRLAGAGLYYLEKGGQRLCLLSCDTGRYDLALFVGREISVNGPRRRPATESLSIVDAERIRVLGVSIR